MYKRSLPIYFILISMTSAVLILTSGLFISVLERGTLANRIYQMKPLLPTEVYVQIMDDVIPGQHSAKINPLQSMLSILFGYEISNPTSILQAEIPMLRNRQIPIQMKDARTNEKREFNLDDVAKHSSSTLSDQAPVPAENSSKIPSVFVYHTHSRESWISEVGDKDNPFHESKNITLLGKHFAERLEKIGIPVHFNQTDHDQILVEREMTRAMAYAVSANTVANAIRTNPEIEYIFDFHRDAVDRKYTTVTIDGVDYAKVMFVIGKQNKYWQENQAFAEQLQQLLEEKYQGICRPIASYERDRSHNGEYNQSYSNHALTVEIGGIGNTFEESIRTVEILADVFAEWYLDAVPVFLESEGIAQ